jgi:spermidine/putrescine transport system permease protein
MTETVGGTKSLSPQASPGVPGEGARGPGNAAWLAFIPLVIWLLLLVVAPSIILIVFSFCDSDELGQPVFQFTLDNYRQIFEKDLLPVFWHLCVSATIVAIVAITTVAIVHRKFSFAALRWGLLLGGGGYLFHARGVLPAGEGTYLKIFWDSAELAGLTTLLCLMVSYPVAFFIGRSNSAWRNRLLLLVMIPFWTSFLIRTYAWITILNQNGLLNHGLKTLGLQALIPASGGYLYTPTAVVIGLVYAYLPFMILPIFGSVEKLDNSLVEAALDLGAGPIRTMLNVVLPLTQPGIVAGVLLVFVPAIGMFAVTDLMSGNRFPLLGSEIANQFGEANNQPLGAALGVTLMLMFGLVFLVTGFRRPGGVE